MAASYVQKAQARGAGVTSMTTVAMTTTTGNTVAVSVGSGATFSSVTDNGTSNTVTAVAADSFNPGGGALALTVKCLQNINGRTGHTFTANFSSSDFVSMTASEITGVVAASLDTGSVAFGNDTASPYTLTSGTFAQADEIVLLFNESYAGGVSTFAESTGFTSIGGENDNNNYCTNWNWYKSISATTALTPSLTDSTGTGYAGMLMVVAGFKSAASGSVTGTVAWTEANDAAALAGNVRVSGAPSWTEANDAAAIAGSLIATGAAAWTEASDSAALSGSLSVPGGVSWTEANDSSAIAGALTVSGAAAWTETNDAAALSGTVGNVVAGAIAWTESDDAAALSGALTVSAPVAWVEASDAWTVAGMVTQPATGAVAWIEASDSWQIAGTSGAATGGIDTWGGVRVRKKKKPVVGVAGPLPGPTLRETIEMAVAATEPKRVEPKPVFDLEQDDEDAVMLLL